MIAHLDILVGATAPFSGRHEEGVASPLDGQHGLGRIRIEVSVKTLQECGIRRIG